MGLHGDVRVKNKASLFDVYFSVVGISSLDHFFNVMFSCSAGHCISGGSFSTECGVVSHK